MRNFKVRKLTGEEEKQRERLAARLKGVKREPCVESDFMPCCDEDVVEDDR